MIIDIIRVVISAFTGGDVPKWSGTGREGEEFTDQTAMQHYGYSSNIPSDSVGISITLGDKALLIASDNADRRPELNEGEVCLYFDKENYIKMQADGKLAIKNNTEELITIISDLIGLLKTVMIPTALGPQLFLPTDIVKLTDIETRVNTFKE